MTLNDYLKNHPSQWIEEGQKREAERQAKREAAYTAIFNFREAVKAAAKEKGLTARVNEHTFKSQGGLGISGYDLVLFQGQDNVVFEMYIGEISDAKLAECLKAIDETAANLQN